MNNVVTTVLSTISQGARYPVIIILIALILVTLALIVMAIVEYVTERKNFKVSVPAFIRQLEESDCQSIPALIATSDLVKRQKVALMTLFNARDLPEEARWNIAKRSVYEFTEHYRRRAAVAQTIAKLAPMIGLMGTLIPLGPGLQALGEKNLAALADALIVAFDTTVVGLIAAACCLLVAKAHERWNSDYINALESMQGTLFDKIIDLTEVGDLEYKAPQFELVNDTSAVEKADKKNAPENPADTKDGE